LAEANQEVAPTVINGARSGRRSRLGCLTQNDVSEIPTCGLKLAPARRTVKTVPLDGWPDRHRENLCSRSHAGVTMAHSCSRAKILRQSRLYAANKSVSGHTRPPAP